MHVFYLTLIFDEKIWRKFSFIFKANIAIYFTLILNVCLISISNFVAKLLYFLYLNLDLYAENNI